MTDEQRQWKIQLYQRLRHIRQQCGILCHIDSPILYQAYQTHTPDWPYWDMIQLNDWYNNDIDNKNHDDTNDPHDPHLNHQQHHHEKQSQQCIQFIQMEENDASDGTFPRTIPHELLPYYSMNGYVSVTYYRPFLQNSYLDARVITWSVSLIERNMKQLKQRKHRGTYGIRSTNMIQDFMNNGPISIKGQRVLVIGTERPWIECILLNLDAKEVTTLEYSTIVSEYPRLNTMTPHEFRTKYMNGSLVPYDIIVSHSSLEHPGLGRYRDALNPWGDLIGVARAWCITKPGGYMLLGLPTGLDWIEYNAHRVYGKYRWPLMTTNWIPIQSSLPFSNGTELLRRPNWKDGGHLYWFQKPNKPFTESIVSDIELDVSFPTSNKESFHRRMSQQCFSK
jgi:Caenorhabditis protein of unknown function, DUF268